MLLETALLQRLEQPWSHNEHYTKFDILLATRLAIRDDRRKTLLY